MPAKPNRRGRVARRDRVIVVLAAERTGDHRKSGARPRDSLTRRNQGPRFAPASAFRRAGLRFPRRRSGTRVVALAGRAELAQLAMSCQLPPGAARGPTGDGRSEVII